MSPSNLPSSIPVTTTVKKKASSPSSDDESEQKNLRLKIKKFKKDLEAQESFDADFWVGRRKIADMELQSTRLYKKVSVQDFQKTQGGDEQAWLQTPAAKDLIEQEKSLALQSNLCKDRLSNLHLSALHAFLAHGADLHALAPDYPAPSQAQRAGRHGTPLHSAAAAGNIEAVSFLLERGADSEVKNEEGCTAGGWPERVKKGKRPRGVIRGDVSKGLKRMDSRGLIVT